MDSEQPTIVSMIITAFKKGPSPGTHPYSIRKLDKFTRRTVRSLSRTLKTISHYGLVEVKRGKNRVIPVAREAEFRNVAT
jgi:DNA-binding transcriptional regulator YhcF (GntR family)